VALGGLWLATGVTARRHAGNQGIVGGTACGRSRTPARPAAAALSSHFPRLPSARDL